MHDEAHFFLLFAWFTFILFFYCSKEGKPVGPVKSAPPPPAPTKPDLIPKPSDPIPITRPQAPAVPVVAKTPEPPKPAPPKPARPDPPKQSPPKTPARQSPPKPSPPRPSPPKVTEPLKPKASPPKTPELFKPQTPPVRPGPQSREDELFEKTLNFGQKSDQNGSRFAPQDLSYSSVAKGDSAPRYTERPVVSNPDSLESSESEE